MKKVVAGITLLLVVAAGVFFLVLKKSPEEAAAPVAEKVVGSVISTKGTVQALRNTGEVILSKGSEIMRKDIITTDEKGYARIVFTDQTLVAIGKNGKLSIDDYVFENNGTEAGTDFWFQDGMFESITGMIGKIAPDKMKLKARTATMGIRGTHIVGDLTDVKKIKIACIEGKIEVKSQSVTRHVRIEQGKKVEVDSQVLDTSAEVAKGNEIVIETTEVILEKDQPVPVVKIKAPEPKEFTYEKIAPILKATGNEDDEKIEKTIQQSLKLLTSAPEVKIKRGIFYVDVGINTALLKQQAFKIIKQDKNIKLRIDRKSGVVRITPPDVVYGEYAFTVDATSAGFHQQKEYIVVVEKNREWENVFSGDDFVVAIKTDKSMWAWGENRYGNLGDGTTKERKDPVAVEADRRWKYAAAGSHHALGIDKEGKLWAWGDNSKGQLGDGTTTERHWPVLIDGDHNWSVVSAGTAHSLAVRSDGTLWGWGENIAGKIGDGTTISRNFPKRIGFDNDWKTITSGDHYNLALKEDGTLWSWGQNEYGQIGQSSRLVVPEPTQIGSGKTWRSIAASGATSFAIQKDGSLWAWGYNKFGQLGNGAQNDLLSPQKIAAKQSWRSVYPGKKHTAAIDQNGRLWAWGNNDSRQIGNSSSTHYLKPQQISAETGWLFALSGENYTLALKPDRSFEAWGKVNRKMVETLVVDVRGDELVVADK